MKRPRYDAGYFGIGIENVKTPSNVGTLWRSGYAFGAGFMCTLGTRYTPQASDTTKTWLHLPLWQFDDVESLRSFLPRECLLVGVELSPESTPLEGFNHPSRCIYLLGPEDGSLSKSAQDLCHHIVQIDSKTCLNVATAGSIVMYDRKTKETKLQVSKCLP